MRRSQAPLYDRDFAVWAFHNAELLRSGRIAEADIENIAEELESMGKSQHRELTSRVRVLLVDLLKLGWTAPPSDKALRSWRATVTTQRLELAKLLPSLRRTIGAEMERSYSGGRKLAALQTGLDLAAFPDTCPFTAAQITNPSFFPRPR